MIKLYASNIFDAFNKAKAIYGKPLVLKDTFF